MSKMKIGLLGISKNVNKWFSARIAVGIMALFLVMAGGAGAVTPISDCTTISSPGTYALTRNIGNSANSIFCISITSSDVVFDGAGYTIDGTDATDTTNTYGVYVYNPSTVLTQVTLKNLLLKNWRAAINYSHAQNGVLDNNNISNVNYDKGIVLSNSSNNILNNNKIVNGYFGIQITDFSNYNTLSSNNISNSNYAGIYIDSNNDNNTIIGNNISNGQMGISLYGSGNIITGNIFKLNRVSISLSSAADCSRASTKCGSYNIISGNNITNGGIALYYSSKNTVSNNNILDSTTGLDIQNGHNLTIINNKITSGFAGHKGISIVMSSDIIIYNNFFNTTNNYYGYAGYSKNNNNIWNINKTLGTNIVGGPYLGGNVWSYPGGTGYSNTCNDADSDGICDSSRTLDASNIDKLPLVYIPAIPAPAVTPTTTTIKITPTTTAAQRTATPTMTTVKITSNTTTTQRTAVTVSPKVPGFEIVSMIASVGIAIFLLRRKK